MILWNRHFLKISCISALAMILVSCSSEEDDSTSEATTSTSSTEVKESVETILGSGDNTATSISAMPNMSTFLGDSSSSLRLTAGEPAFTDIDTEDEIETYLTGNIETLLSEISDKITEGDFDGSDGVEKKIKKFQEAALKCEMMESTIGYLSELRDQTTSACYISEISQSNGGFLTYKSGTEYTDDDEVLLPSQDGSDKLVQLDIGTSESDDAQTIMIAITAADKILKYELDFCDADGNSTGRDTIEFDHSIGSDVPPLLRLTSRHAGGETTDNFSFNYGFHAVLQGPLEKDAEGDYTFKAGSERTFKAFGHNIFSSSSSTSNDYYRSLLTITDDELIIRERANGNETFSESGNTIKIEHGSRSLYGVNYSGTTIASTAILSGAGRRFWANKVTEGSNSSSEQGADRIAFIYNADATPRYETKSGAASALLAKISKINKKEDEILKDKPAKISFDLTTNRCGDTPTTYYELDVANETFIADIESKCENDLEEEDFDLGNMCHYIRRAQDDILGHQASLESNCSDCILSSEEEDEDLTIEDEISIEEE